MKTNAEVLMYLRDRHKGKTKEQALPARRGVNHGATTYLARTTSLYGQLGDRHAVVHRACVIHLIAWTMGVNSEVVLRDVLSKELADTLSYRSRVLL